MDQVDHANALADAEREAALAAHQERRAAQRTPMGNACEACGERIHPKRRKVLPETVHCFDCACERERQTRQGRR